jgi:hypothetical protein
MEFEVILKWKKSRTNYSTHPMRPDKNGFPHRAELALSGRYAFQEVLILAASTLSTLSRQGRSLPKNQKPTMFVVPI